jgi:hypothetical protein
MMTDEIIHLAAVASETTGGIVEVWCEAPAAGPDGLLRHASEEIEIVTCIDCLTSAVTHGNKCLARRGQLRREKGERFRREKE